MIRENGNDKNLILNRIRYKITEPKSFRSHSTQWDIGVSHRSSYMILEKSRLHFLQSSSDFSIIRKYDRKIRVKSHSLKSIELSSVLLIALAFYIHNNRYFVISYQFIVFTLSVCLSVSLSKKNDLFSKNC